jgi:Lar family restriction alleviation protein
MTTDLEPCPFCGGVPYQGSETREVGELDWFVACGNYCGAACEAFESQDEAIAAWNRRAPSDESLDRISQALGLGTPAASVDNMAREIERLRDGDRAQLRMSEELARGRWFVDKLRRYFDADLRVKNAESPKLAVPAMEERERISSELRKAVVG